MDKEFLAMWFSAFDKGLSSLSAPAREALLSPCAARCADSYPVKLYERARAQSKGELDAFFILLGREKGIEARVLMPGESWQILYPACGCDLVTAGYVSAPAQCECSRLSIAYCLGQVWPGHRFTVTIEQSILQGDSCCRFLIERIKPHDGPGSYKKL